MLTPINIIVPHILQLIVQLLTNNHLRIEVKPIRLRNQVNISKVYFSSSVFNWPLPWTIFILLCRRLKKSMMTKGKAEGYIHIFCTRSKKIFSKTRYVCLRLLSAEDELNYDNFINDE